MFMVGGELNDVRRNGNSLTTNRGRSQPSRIKGSSETRV